MKYKIVGRNDDSIVYGKGESVMVLFDYQENKIIPIAEDFLEKISKYSKQQV